MKKILSSILVLMMFMLVGCSSSNDGNNGSNEGDSDVLPEETLTLDQAYSQLTISGDLNNVYGNLNLVSSVKNVAVSWATSNSAVVTNEGVITTTTEDQNAVLTATLSLNNDTKTKEFNITVKADNTHYDTIEEVVSKSSGTTVTIKAVVAKLRGNDFFIQDSTGGLFVYANTTNLGVSVGDTIKLVGKMGTYGNAVQVAPTSASVLSTGSKVEVTEITDLTSSTISANMYQLVSIKNVNIDSLGSYSQSSDFNFTVSVGNDQLTAHINKRNSDSDRQDIADVLSELSSESVVNFNNIVVSQYNSNNQLLICSGNDIEEANVTTEVKIERIKKSLSTLTDLNGKEITSNLNLVTSSLYSSAIAWTSNNSAITTSGVVTRPEAEQPNVAVTLSYTVTVDGQTFSGTINVTVKAKAAVGDLISYYDDAVGYTGDDLEAALKKIISTNVKTLSYSDIWDTCEEGNEDPSNPNNVILFYSGLSVSKSDHVSGSSGWNREHTWPQSLGGYKTDAHHIMPTDNKINSTRGNNKFAMGGSNVTSSYGQVSDSKSTGSTFEPRDEVKGDVARICMYVAVKYGFTINTVISLDLALQWHEQDPVDEFEMNRNEVLYGFQNNRNPFIDYPDFASLIWS